MEAEGARLDFAYKYPFTKEARELVASINPKLEDKLINAGKIRVEEAVGSHGAKFEKTSMENLKMVYLLSYVYSRMLVSAMNDRYTTNLYADAEARRAAQALADDTAENVARVAEELGVDVAYDADFRVRFEKFLEIAPRFKEFSLVNQNLSNGFVHVSKAEMSRLLGGAVKKSVLRGLPIPLKELPQEIVRYAKGISVPRQKIAIDVGTDGRRYEWIEKLLQNPIADVRHRTVNLILAPYLTNVKKMDEESAANVIIEYIERCKQINPDTKVNQTYIRYQCKYSKEKGMRPLSFNRAKELLKGIVELGG